MRTDQADETTDDESQDDGPHLDLRSANALIRSTARAFKDTHTGTGEWRRLRGDNYGRLQIFGVDVLKIYVTPASVPRALAAMDLLIKKLEANGWVVKVQNEQSSTGRKGTLACRDGEEFEIALFEKTDSKRVRDLSSPHSHACTGVLEFVHLDTTGAFRAAESSKHRIDAIVPRFVERLERAAERRAVRNAERDEWHRRWEQQRQAEAAIARAKADEEERRRTLQSDAAKWNQAEQIRHYISAVEARAATKNTDVASWAEWARKVAAEIDPTLSNKNQAFATPASPSTTNET